MQLLDLFKGVHIIDKEFVKELDITSVEFDADKVIQGCLYFNLKNSPTSAITAFERGAVCMVVDKPLGLNVPQILAKSARIALSYACANFYGYDPNDFIIIGVTGTNGKTTTTHLISQILTKMGEKTCLIGTEGITLDTQIYPAKLTTPDPTDLFKIFADCKRAGVRYVIMEVSAHASALHKVEPIKFDSMVLTNITQDHLDFFKTMENYAQYKYRLVQKDKCKHALINIDDPTIKAHFQTFDTHIETIGQSFSADYTFSIGDQTVRGSTCHLNDHGVGADFATNLIGEYNVYNLMSAVAVCLHLGYDLRDLVEVVGSTHFVVPGRMEQVHLPSGATAVIDYAHTPDGVEKFLSSLKNLCQGRLIGVFGCGGNRDKTKRAIMGDIASRICDRVIVTSDNPRDEDPNMIIKDIVSGINLTNFDQITNRTTAVEKAISMSKTGDIVAIFGKGAEKTQEIKGVKYAYNDRDVIRDITGV